VSIRVIRGQTHPLAGARSHGLSETEGRGRKADVKLTLSATGSANPFVWLVCVADVATLGTWANGLEPLDFVGAALCRDGSICRGIKPLPQKPRTERARRFDWPVRQAPRPSSGP
jgi:hypothetical protein